MTEDRYLIRAVIDRTSFAECVAIDGRVGTRDEMFELIREHLRPVLNRFVAARQTDLYDASPCRCLAHPLEHAGPIRAVAGDLDNLRVREIAGICEGCGVSLAHGDDHAPGCVRAEKPDLELVLVCKGCGMDTGVHAPGCPELDPPS